MEKISIYDFCDRFLTKNTVIRIEYLTSNDFRYQGTVLDLYNTIDADLRVLASNANVEKIIPTLTLSEGIPISITFLV